MSTDTSLSNLFANLAEALIKSSQQGHSGIVLRGTEILREELLRAIEVQVKPLNAAAVKRLLGSYSPPSDFYTRIEVANKLGILDAEAYRILQFLVSIRNKFGHPKSMCSLDTEPVLALFRKLHTNPLYKGSYIQVFYEYIIYVNDTLEVYLVKFGVIDNISERNRPKVDGEA